MKVALALLLSPAGISAAQFPAGVSAKIEDLAGESRPLSHVLSYLNEADGPKPKMDLWTVASIWTVIDGTWLKGKAAAVFNNTTRVEILEETFISEGMVTLDHHRRPSLRPDDRFQVDKINIKLSTPYLQALPAVSKAVCDGCKKFADSALFKGVSPYMRIGKWEICKMGLFFPLFFKKHVVSWEAQECVEEVLREILTKFDWSSDVSLRTVRGFEDGEVVGKHLCAGESYFSQNSRLAASHPFNPANRGGPALIQVVLDGKNAFMNES